MLYLCIRLCFGTNIWYFDFCWSWGHGYCPSLCPCLPSQHRALMGCSVLVDPKYSAGYSTLCPRVNLCVEMESRHQIFRIDTHVYTHTHTHIYIHTYIHIYIYTYTYIYMLCMHACMVCMYVCMSVCMCVCVYVYLYICTYVHMYICIYVYMYVTYMHKIT